MRRNRLSIVFLGACALLGVLLAACPNPISPAKGSSLTISINNNINTRTLLPLIDMNAASFTVNGTGPAGATFSQTTSGAPVTVDSLAFGTWSVTVNALNGAGAIIGSGQATVTVHTGQTATVDISVVPLTGNGTLDLTVTWTASQVESPTIQATLWPPVGSATTLSFSVTGNTGTFSSTTIPAGYQTLGLQLLDGDKPVMGAVDVVRIVAGQTTTGVYTFTNVNQPGGSVQVNITPAMADPIPVSISGVSATVTAGASMTATASVSDGTANPAYVWYLNGVFAGMGSSYTLGSTVTAGWYRLDVTAYAAGGTRAGSATASFQALVSDTPTVFAGGSYRTGLSSSTPCYWQDGTRTDLPGDNAGVSSIAVSAGTVLSAGSRALDFKTSRACYWQGNTLQDLPIPPDAITSSASGIFFSNGVVYIVGNYDTDAQAISCYWQNGARMDLPNPDDYPTSIYVANGTVYLGGGHLSADSVANACYWVDGVRVDFPSAGEGTTSSASSISVSGGSVFVAGEWDSADGSSTACYWRDGVRTDLPGARGHARSISVFSGTAFVAGQYYPGGKNSIACLWQDTMRVELPNGIGSAASVDVRNGIAYVAGASNTGMKGMAVPCYWVGAVRHDLPIPDGASGSAWDIKVQ